LARGRAGLPFVAIATAVTPAAAEALTLLAVALKALLAIAVFKAALTIFLWRLRLASTGDERWQAVDRVSAAGLRLRRLARLVAVATLRLIAVAARWLVAVATLRLVAAFATLAIEIRIARNKRLRIAGAELRLLASGFLRRTVIVAVIVERAVARVVAADGFRALAVLLRLILPQLFLRGGDQAEIMFGVLVIVFGADRVAGGLRVARKLDIFFRHVGRCAADLYVRPVGFKDTGEWIMALAIVVIVIVVVASTHTLVLILNISHGLQFIHP